MQAETIEVIEDTLPVVEVFQDEESTPEVFAIQDISMVEVWIPGPYGVEFPVAEGD